MPKKNPGKPDSISLYKDISHYSKRSKVTRFLYPLIFKPIPDSIPPVRHKKKKAGKLIKNPYRAFEGKIIRQIIITTVDPFGYSISDTSIAKHNLISHAGNSLHIKSHYITISNLLLIRKNQAFDSLLVKESERLVRRQSFVRDVALSFVLASKNSDSVDVYIREMDNWSIIPDGSISTSSMMMKLTDKNILGLGHELKTEFSTYTESGNYSYAANYHIPNIRNSYVNATLHFDRNELNNTLRSLAFDRPFFSPYALWAAGINVTHRFQKGNGVINSPNLIDQRFKSNAADLWAGNSIRIFKGNTEYRRTTNLVTTMRYLRIRYTERSAELPGLFLISNEDFYLMGVGISTRRYVQEKYIFRYGVTEDVPVGRHISLTAGYQVKSNGGRMYLGARYAWGRYYDWGFLGSNTEASSFVHISKLEQITLSASIDYFTNLTTIGAWKFRQFVKAQTTIGINRFPTDSLTLNEGHGLDGFNGFGLTGTHRMLLSFQTQSYSPWNLFGFRFGPFMMITLGMLGTQDSGFRNSKVFTQISFGVLIKNESLVINAFQLSFSYYPLIPGKGQNIFKLNSFRTTDFGYRDFEIGKPGPAVYL